MGYGSSKKAGRQIVLLASLILILLMGLFQPWKYVYHPPSEKGPSVAGLTGRNTSSFSSERSADYDFITSQPEPTEYTGMSMEG